MYKIAIMLVTGLALCALGEDARAQCNQPLAPAKNIESGKGTSAKRVPDMRTVAKAPMREQTNRTTTREKKRAPNLKLANAHAVDAAACQGNPPPGSQVAPSQIKVVVQ